MNRRALLRAGGVVAGIAGIGTYAAASAPSAGAASGDPVLMGAANDAGTADTVVTTAAFAPTLLLSNTGSGAPLRLGERTSADLPTADSGDLLNDNGDLLFAHGQSLLASVYTSLSASQLIPVIPLRALDTRTTAGRANILNGTGN
ncbi:MAG TPA: hypothetical protein VF542_10140, partial [Jatrophihabitans sp.]